MICYASLTLFVYNVLKLLTYHTLFYWQPSLRYQRSNRSGFFGPPCIKKIYPPGWKFSNFKTRRECKIFIPTPYSCSACACTFTQCAKQKTLQFTDRKKQKHWILLHEWRNSSPLFYRCCAKAATVALVHWNLYPVYRMKLARRAGSS